MAVAIGVWCWMAYIYRDINEVNNNLLLRVEQENAEMKALLQWCMLANYALLHKHKYKLLL